MTRSLAESLHGVLPDVWARDFLQAAAFPTTSENVRAVVSWEYAESGGGGGDYNPLNTTQGGYAGETNFNTVGVKNYVRYEDGIAANAKVIHNGYYTAAVALFAQGDNARATCDAITRSPWGTGFIVLMPAAPQPAPTIEETMILIASPHPPTLEGRVAAATWDVHTPNVVILTNGASIAHDSPLDGGKRLWVPPMRAGHKGVGIMAEIGADGKPNGAGVVFQDDHGETFRGRWS